jgi:CheY-like chemotaxis protein
MAERDDNDEKTAFVLSLPRKMTELRATLGTIVADTRSSRMRDELRRRLHALYTSARGFGLLALSEGLREGIAHLDALRASASLGQRDLDTLSEFIASLSTLAQRDLPDRPELFERPRDRGPAAPPSARGSGDSVLSAIATSTATPQSGGAPSVPPPAHAPGSRAPSVRPPAFNAGAPVGVLVVGGAGLVSEVRRASPKDAEITTVRTLAEAVLAARDASPDVIVAESVQPADGVGIVAAMRGDPLTDFIPVIVVTSPGERVDEATLKQHGVFETLTTPINPAQLGRVIGRAVETLLRPSMPPPSFGDLTLEELTKALQDEIRRGLMGAAGPNASSTRVPLGQGTEVLAATWEAIARVREVVARRTHGRVRFEMPSAPLGMGGAHVLAVGDDEAMPEQEGDDPLPARRALVVDDEPNVVWFFANLLREAGMEVVECNDGAQALRDARKTRPDVVISDILMPGMDGFTLCRAIRRDVSIRYTPVVLLSWREDLITRMRELGAQAQGYLRKESKGEAILARVRSVLRPRVRLLRRIESLDEGEELRGRVERVGVFSLIEVAAKSLRGATITVTDSFSVTEVELRGGRLVSVMRTAEDGSLSRGEGALVQVLGASAARFSVKRATHAVRSNVHGELDSLLEGGAALIVALEDAVSGASLVEVASLDIDADAARSYAKTLPGAMRALIEKVAGGDSPRELVLRDGVAPQELDPLLVELARRGVIRGAKGPSGEDLVAPRITANSPRTIEGGGPPIRVSTTMPAVLLPESLAEIHPKPASAGDDAATDGQTASANEGSDKDRTEPASSASPATTSAPAGGSEESPPRRVSSPSWKRPTNMDEALAPGFGERESDSLADALLAELKDPAVPLATMKVRDEEVSEADEPAAKSATESDSTSAVIASLMASDSTPPVTDPAENARAPASVSDEVDVSTGSQSTPRADRPENNQPIALTTVKSAEPERIPFSMEPPPPGSADAAPTGVVVGDRDATRQREVSGERPTAGTPDAEDGPSFEESESEAHLSEDELHAAAHSSPGLPLEGIDLDARGLPRRRARTQDVAKVSEGHTPQPVSTSDSSIIIDVAAVGGPVEVTEPPPRKRETTDERVNAGGSSAWLWLALAVVALGFGSYYVVRALLPPPTLSNDANQGAAIVGFEAGATVASQGDDSGVAESTEDASSGAVANSDDDASVANTTDDAGATSATDDASVESVESAQDASGASNGGEARAAGMEFDLDPTVFLDGSTMTEGRGLLVVDGPGHITVGTRDLGESPLRVELLPGQHNLTYRRGNVRGFRVIEVEARRAVRLVLPNEP